MTDLRTAATQALEALEQCGLDDTQRSYEFEHAARVALRVALAEPVQPVSQAEIEAGPHAGITTPADYTEPVQPVAFDIQKALKRAYRLGQNYWADADSESYRAYKRAEKHQQDFEALCAEALEYTAQPQRTPLSDDDLRRMWAAYAPLFGGVLHFARAIERAHGITTQETN